MTALNRGGSSPTRQTVAHGEKPDWQTTERELQQILASRPELRSLIDPLNLPETDYLREVAEVKRFCERWRADPKFRKLLPSNPAGVTAEYGLSIDPEWLRSQWDPSAPVLPLDQEALPLQRHRFFIREKLLFREKLRAADCAPSNPSFRHWRERQVRRGLTHLGIRSYEGIVHGPLAIELSDGCSVGCWFCGVSAKKKAGDYRYTPENAVEWREILAVLKRVIGPAATQGFLYWASDPLDNPDYEKFATDFANALGRFPQTTTSIAHRDLERTRRLLQLSQSLGCVINRFSILSLGQFNKILTALTPEELLHCELVLQNAESTQMQSQAGRARGHQKLERRRSEARDEPITTETAPDGTIACVSGFLLNMVRRTVRLISPCPSSVDWPNGYWLFEERHFTDAADLERVMESMIERWMPVSIQAGRVVRFRPDLTYQGLEDGFELAGRGIKQSFRAAKPEGLMRFLGDKILEGASTAGELALVLEDRWQVKPTTGFDIINQLFDAGQLDEAPVPAVEEVIAPEAVGAVT